MGAQKESISVSERLESEGSFYEVRPGVFRVEDNKEVLIPNNRLILVITGPTGAGKDTIRDLLPEDKFVSFKTCTTRPRRPAEPEGEDDPYHRLSREEFELGIAKGDFFEVNHYNDHIYGGRVSDVEKIMNQNKVPVFRIDPQGADNYLALWQSGQPPFEGTLMISVFVTPPDFDVLMQRLYKRDVEPYLGPDNQEELIAKFNQRVEIAGNELEKLVAAHFVVLNMDGCLTQICENLTETILELQK